MPSNAKSLPFETVFTEELIWIGERRQEFWTRLAQPDGEAGAAGKGLTEQLTRPEPQAEPVAAPADDAAAPPALNAPPHAAAPAAEPAAARDTTLELGLVGLCFSGGGIRSATLATGFLQGLAKLRLLGIFDYLSSVSGGGYAASWFSAWVHREKDLTTVEQQLDPSRVEQAKPSRPPLAKQTITDQEPEPLHFLRSFSRYLAPRSGLFSADTWTLLAIYLRNTLINLTVLVSFLVGFIFLSRLAIWFFAQPRTETGTHVRISGPGSRQLIGPGGRQLIGPGGWELEPSWVFVMCVAFAAIVLFGIAILRYYVDLARTNPTTVAKSSECSRRWFVALVGAIFILAVLVTWSFGIAPDAIGKDVTKDSDMRVDSVDQDFIIKAFLAPLWFPVGVFYLFKSFGRVGWRRPLFLALSSLLFVTVVFLILPFAFHSLIWRITVIGGPEAVTTLGPPVVMAVFLLAGVVDALIFGWAQSEYEFEMHARLSAYLLLALVAWLVFFAVTLYLPRAFNEIGHHIPEKWLKPAAIIGWLATTAGGVLAGRGIGAEGPSQTPPLWKRLLLPVAPPVFILGLLALLSLLVSWFLSEGLWTKVRIITPDSSGLEPLVGALVCVAILVAGYWLVDVNRFSLHALYANRLVRCYLGAPWPKQDAGQRTPGGGLRGGAPAAMHSLARRNNRVTGFDPADDFALSALYQLQTPGAPVRFRGPFPILNTALQLVGGDDLALQDRKAAAFFLTPICCGSDATGYVRSPTDEKDAQNLTLGRAMAISGAAVDSNMAVYQSPPLTALLTVFNARLGWWLRNPARADAPDDWDAKGPGVSMPLLWELFGQTHEDRKYVRLSDGGHFENLGAYELIRRRCRYVVVCDFAEDPNDASENLANLMRLVRTDFGIRIEIDTSPLRKNAEKLSRWHVAVGTIRYEDRYRDALSGTLVFIRSSLTGDESPDIRQYATKHPSFPHQGTIDQFFDAQQFESYRALGEHLATSVFTPVRHHLHLGGLRNEETHRRAMRQFFARLRTEWFPPPPDFSAKYTEAGRMFADLMVALRDDKDLNRLAGDLYPELRHGMYNPAQPNVIPPIDDVERRELLAVNHILDVMELTWLGVQLNSYASHPLNRGWLNAFRRWTTSDSFEKYWPVLRGEYSKDFVRFCERALNLTPVTPALCPYVPGDAQHIAWVENLEVEYLREWGDHLDRIVRDRFPRLTPQESEQRRDPTPRRVRDAALADPDGRVWLLTIPLGRLAAGAQHPVGMIALRKVGPIQLPTETAPKNLYELFFWIRGAYRSLGFGTQCLESRSFLAQEPVADRTLFEWIVAHLKPHADAILTRYPATGTTGAERVQEALWRNFFYDYEFRYQHQKGSEPFIYLVRRLG